MLGFLLTLIVVDVTKYLCGQLRPTFIEACRPDWTQCHRDASRHQLSSTNVCQQTDRDLLLQAQ